ncbi:hypothetical protein AX17_001679 [Amanita inopinata Kibby_2008]|nr:hypothetical protein AX17_001679 [Amanita inopinata Kibby_2008]
MMLMTILAILAVDFPVFPRTLAKCETFGVSLMDLGVGSFVFSQGVISAIPLLRDPRHLTSPVFPKLFSVIRKTLPVLFLGLVRLLLVKATEYPEHVSEYGVHWNFFLTLALLPTLQVILHPLILHVPISFLGIVIAIAHQLLLSYAHLQGYILNAPRTSWLSANKEGIISLIGYLSIHLLGLSIGTIVLPPSPSWFRRLLKYQSKVLDNRRIRKYSEPRVLATHPNADDLPPLSSPRHTGKTVIELCSYALLWCIFSGAVGLLKIGVDSSGSKGNGLGKNVSRRMANLPYILWVAAFNTSFLLAYFLVDMIFYRPTQPRKASTNLTKSDQKMDVARSVVRENKQQALSNAPPLLDAINRNGLALFLLANVCTGLINLSINTMEASNTRAILVLLGYSYGLCAAAWTTRDRRLVKL